MNKLKRTTIVAAGIGVALTMIGCGTARGEELTKPEVNWEAPLIDGVSQPSVAAAQSLVRFKVVAPAFGTPALIQVDDPARMPESQRTVAFVFHTADGTVVVEESAQGGWTVARLKERANTPIVQAASSSAPSGVAVRPFRMVPARQTEALLGNSGSLGIMWIEDGTLFQMFGPSVTPAQLQSLVVKL